MRGKLLFLGGLAAGFVLGARAGRERYEELVVAARKVRDNPTVQEAAGVVQEQASKLVTGSKEMLTDKLGHSRLGDTRLGERMFHGKDVEADEQEPELVEETTLTPSGSTRVGNPAGATTASGTGY
jgi:hypothetical protein